MVLRLLRKFRRVMALTLECPLDPYLVSFRRNEPICRISRDRDEIGGTNCRDDFGISRRGRIGRRAARSGCSAPIEHREPVS